MRILFKILLLPFALVFMLLSGFISFAGDFLSKALGVVSGIFALAFVMFLIRGIREGDMQTANLIMCGVFGSIVTMISMFIESLGYRLSRFSAWVLAF